MPVKFTFKEIRSQGIAPARRAGIRSREEQPQELPGAGSAGGTGHQARRTSVAGPVAIRSTSTKGRDDHEKAVIVSTARTGLAKSWKAPSATHSLGSHVVKAAANDQSVWTRSRRRDGLRDAGRRAEPEHRAPDRAARRVPVSVPGMTINRCSSGLQTIATAAQQIIAGENDILVAGGVGRFHSSRTKPTVRMAGPVARPVSKPEIYWTMQTAEQVAKALQDRP